MVGVVISPAIQVELVDEDGNRLTSATDVVSIAISEPGALLVGTTSGAAVAGLATFANVAVDTVGTWTIIPGAGPFISPLSRQFTVTPFVDVLSIESALVALVAQDAPLTELIGSRFYPVDEASQNGATPYVTYTLIDHPTVKVMSRDSLAQPRVQFDCFADTRSQARAACRAVVNCFDRAVWSYGGIRVTASLCENRGMDFDREDSSLRPRCLSEFVFTYELN